MGQMSQAEFAVQIDVPVQTLNNWLTGRVGNPQEKNLLALAQLSGVSVVKLKGMIAASDQSESELDVAFEIPISDPGEAIAKRLGVYQAELELLIQRLDRREDDEIISALRNLLSSIEQVETLMESHVT